jgi:FtsP/CotA-like multicopper oxidase with cupredoxin domain
MVVNHLPETTSIHWHGIELDSYFDGVPGLSGIKPQLAPTIAPNDSFEVRITPPRSGTFIYHTHMNEARQHRAGLVGALIVVDRGKYDATRNVAIVASSPSDSVQEESAVLFNGSATPPSLELKRATAYRLRLINITTGRPGLRFELKEDSTTQMWRTISKDGADIPAANRTLRPARQSLSIGETMDVEIFTARVGDFKLEAQTQGGGLLAVLPIRVR